VTSKATTTTPKAHFNKWARREIRVRGDKPTTESFKQLPKSAEHVRAILNAKITECGQINIGARSTASRHSWVESVKLLPSGDLYLYAVDAPTADRLVYHHTEWEKVLGPKARVIVPTYTVVMMSDIRIRSMKMGNQMELIEMLRGENERVLGDADIERVRWLGKPAEGKFTNAAVIEFLDPEMANSVLNEERLTWEGNPKKVCRFDKRSQST
jgi:hypothetical protein